jgi:DNA polymerase I
MHLPPQRKPSKGGFPGGLTSDEEAIKKLRRLVPASATVLNLLLDYRGQSKDRAQLACPLEVRDGSSYFITSYNATGTTTGRISSSEHILGAGGNLQNQKRGPSRRCFVARPGMVFVKADGSQAEARVVAALCGDRELLDRFEQPDFDIHLENAQLLYGGTVAELKAEDKAWKAALASGGVGGDSGGVRDSRRQRTKSVTHGSNYRGGPNVAVKQADIPFAEAKLAVEKYRRGHPLLLRWWEWLDQEILSTRRLVTCWGRLRIFFGRIDDSTMREATAFEPQSTVGDLINHAFYKLDERLASVGAYPLLQAHDEIVVECPVRVVRECAVMLREELEQPLAFRTGISIRIPAEVSTGPNWYDQEKVRG